MSDKLSVSLQENLLVLLCFDGAASSLIRNSVEERLFSSQAYRDIAGRCYAYIDQFKVPPGDHLPDLFEEDLKLKTDQADQYRDILGAIGDMRNRVNKEYILGKLEKFVREQTLKTSIISASEAIQDNDPDTAEEHLLKGIKTRLAVFSPGSRLVDITSKVFNQTVRQNVLATGIRELDKWDLGPGRGELHLFIGPPKGGKSWWLVHLAKRGIIHHMRVLVITLELSEAQWGQRILQSLFSMSRRQQDIPVTHLITDSLGRLMHFDRDRLSKRPSFDNVANRPMVEQRIKRIHSNDNFIVKQFPAGQLTVKQLDNYIDTLERSTGFIPDLVILDYPDYMRLDPKNYRLEMSVLYNELRGLAVERNVALAVASKSNREGAKARQMTSTHAGEDYSKIFTADTIFTYSQSDAERNLGLARLYVDSSRVAERDKFIVLLSQAYPVGQFCISSATLIDRYDGMVEQASGLVNQEEQPEGGDE